MVGFACPNCARQFTSRIGLGVHRQRTHREEFQEDVRTGIVSSKPRWRQEEIFLLAGKKIELAERGVANLSQQLHLAFPLRSVKSIKSKRKQQSYRNTLEQLRRE